jgi:hypothetical protein
MNRNATTKTKAIEDIARRVLALESLETRNSDALDFHEIAIWKVREALEAAYEAGTHHASTRADDGR